MPSNSTIEALDSLGVAFDFIDCWIKLFDQTIKLDQISIWSYTRVV